MSGQSAHPNVKRHPTAHRIWNPDAKVTALPWPEHLVVTVDHNGHWWPMFPGAYDQECPRCRGTHVLKNGAAMFCPWCGEPLDPVKARYLEPGDD